MGITTLLATLLLLQGNNNNTNHTNATTAPTHSTLPPSYHLTLTPTPTPTTLPNATKNTSLNLNATKPTLNSKALIGKKRANVTNTKAVNSTKATKAKPPSKKSLANATASRTPAAQQPSKPQQQGKGKSDGKWGQHSASTLLVVGCSLALLTPISLATGLVARSKHRRRCCGARGHAKLPSDDVGSGADVAGGGRLPPVPEAADEPVTG